MPLFQKIKKKIFYLNLEQKFNKASCITLTQAHFHKLRMLISAWLRLGLPSKFGRLVSAYRGGLWRPGVPLLLQ